MRARMAPTVAAELARSSERTSRHDRDNLAGGRIQITVGSQILLRRVLVPLTLPPAHGMWMCGKSVPRPSLPH